MARYQVLRPVDLDGTGLLAPGTIVEGDHLRNLPALVDQRYLRSLGDQDRLEAIENRLTRLEAASGKGQSKH